MNRNSLDCIKANLCDICGDTGVIEAIITCCDCKTSRQHLYCMRVVTTEAPPFWLCEECERRKLFSPTKNDKDYTQKDPIFIPKNTRVSKCPIKTSFASRFNFKEKRVEKGRTKYISCEEAANLSSGNIFSQKNASLKSMAPPPPREKSLSKIYDTSKVVPPVGQTQKSTVMKDSIKSTKSCANVERPNNEKEGDVRKHIEVPKSFKKVDKTITQESTKMDSIKSTKSTPRVEKTNKEKEDDVRKHIEVPKIFEKVEKTITQESTKMVKDKVIPPITARVEKTNKEKEDDMRKHIEVPKLSQKLEKTITQESLKMVKSEPIPPIKEEIDIKPPKSSIKVEIEGMYNHADVAAGSYKEPNPTTYGPVSEIHVTDTSILAFHSYWKGSFYLPNEHENLNGAFKAHPPSSVHSKVYETLNKMPENIKFDLVPVHEVWFDLFKGDCPYKDDIGLYFFSRFKESYEEDCTSLIDFLWSENLVMKSFVGEVELFVFSSRFLQEHSQKFEGDYFLWGVFRSKKVKKEASSKSMIVHESCGQRGVVDSQGSKCADCPPGFEKMYRPPL